MRFWNQIFIIAVLCLIPSLIIIGLFKANLSGIIIIWPIIFAFVVSKFWDEIIVKVEPLRAKIIKDITTGNMRIVGPGWHAKYFWPEKAHKEISLEEIRLAIKEDKYETADSPVTVSGLLVYRPDIKYLLFFIQREKNDLEEILNSLLRNAIGEILSEKKSDNAVKERPEIGRKIMEQFKQQVELYQRKSGAYEQEDMLGILVSNFIINNIKLDPAVQQAKSQEEVEKRQRKSERTETETFLEQVQMWVDKGHTVEKATEIVLSMHGRGKRIVIDMQGDTSKASSVKPRIDLPIDDKD